MLNNQSPLARASAAHQKNGPVSVTEEPSHHNTDAIFAEPVPFTVLSAADREPMTKVLALDEAGALKKGTRANLTRGMFRVCQVRDLAELAVVLDSLKSHQCVTWGRPATDAGNVCTQGNAEALKHGAVPRDREHYRWPAGPGILMLDHDGMPGRSLSGDEFRAMLLLAAPVLADAPMLWRPSASAGCVTPDGRELTRPDRHRIYIPLTDARQVEEAGRALTTLLWAAGYGWCELSKSGQRLLRCLVDTSVWQPERIDFAALPILQDGIQRPQAGHKLYGDRSAQFDAQRLIDAVNAEVLTQANARRRKAKEGMAEAAQEAALRWAGEQAQGLSERRGITIERARQCLIRAATKRILMGDFELRSSSGTTVTVVDLLDSPAAWHGQRFYDPLDPDDDNRVAVVRLFGTRPTLFSHRHGGVMFELRRQSARILLARGGRIEATDNTLAVLRERQELYDYGTAAVAYVTGQGRIVVASRDWLTDRLGRIGEYYSVKLERDDDGNIIAEREQAEDPPTWLATTILAKHGERGFPLLDAVVTAPTLLPDGEVLDVPGYDPKTRLEYVPLSADTPRIPRQPTPEDAVQALARLFAPFRTFPFAGPDDVGVFLAALLSACLRPSLPTCPGFGFDAPAAGSGKTLLAKCIGLLSTGEEPAVTAPAREDEEMRKRLFAGLLSGARVLLIDNLREPLGGAALDAFLTGSTFADRILGKSETSALPNRALFLCSGNNVVLTGDTYRRVLLCRIDPQSETPYKREFDLDPVAYVRDNRLALVRDALTVVRAHITAGGPRSARGNTASFEVWDRLVRQPLMWIAQYAGDAVPTYSDPLTGVERTAAANPENAMLNAVLTAWQAHFGRTYATSREAAQAAQHNAILREALEEVAPARGGDISTRTLARWLAAHKDQLVRGRRLKQKPGRSGFAMWCVEEVNSDRPPQSHPKSPESPATAEITQSSPGMVTSVTHGDFDGTDANSHMEESEVF